MELNRTQCEGFCNKIHLTGRLCMQDASCPFQYRCSCFNETTCQGVCNRTGMIPVKLPDNGVRCQNCSCECIEYNCTAKCAGHAYTLKRNMFGCLDCDCFCPKIDCDAPCGGVGLGISAPRDKAGCSTACNGCRKQQPGEHPCLCFYLLKQI